MIVSHSFEWPRSPSFSGSPNTIDFSEVPGIAKDGRGAAEIRGDMTHAHGKFHGEDDDTMIHDGDQ
jgi:hypothetical protein